MYQEITFQQILNDFNQLREDMAFVKRLLMERDQKPEMDQLLTIEEASEFLNKSKQTLYRYSFRGEIPVSKRGGRLYFLKQDLMLWIKSGKRKTNEEIMIEADAFILGKRKR